MDYILMYWMRFTLSHGFSGWFITLPHSFGLHVNLDLYIDIWFFIFLQWGGRRWKFESQGQREAAKDWGKAASE